MGRASFIEKGQPSQPMPLRAHFTFSHLQLTTQHGLFTMRIYQQHQFDPCATAIDMESDTILSSSDYFALLNLVIPSDDAPLASLEKEQTSVLNSSEFLTLLNLVIPGNDAPLAPLEMEQITSYGHPSPGFTSHEWVSPPMPPQQGLVGFDCGDSSAQSLANSCSDASACIIPPVMMHTTEPFLNAASLIEPWTSLLRPEAAFDVPTSDGKQTFARPCELVTPLELFQDSFKPSVQDVKRYPKASDKCIVPGCKTKKQSHGRCMRHGGGRRCVVVGCINGAQTKGLCKRHGGGARCKAQNCSRSSQSGGLCRTHGGGKLCIAPGCKKGAQRHGKCAMHSSRKCSIDGCSSVERCGGFCGRHKLTKQ